jgi:hypothetical protein
MESVRAAWLEALIEASGTERRWVNAREVAAVLARRRGTPQQVSSQAAGANLRRLRSDGLVEADQSDSWSWWRPTDAGIAAAETAWEPEPRATTPPRNRLADVVAAFNRGDLGFIDGALAVDVMVAIPGSGVLGGVFRGAEETLTMVARAETRIRPNVQVIDLAEEEAEASVSMRVTGTAPDGGAEDLDVLMRCRFDDRGRIAEAWVLPADQSAWDRVLA